LALSGAAGDLAAWLGVDAAGEFGIVNHLPSQTIPFGGEFHATLITITGIGWLIVHAYGAITDGVGIASATGRADNYDQK